MDLDRGFKQLRPSTARKATVARRVDALFKAMSGDFLLREQFVTEPTQIIGEYLHGRKIPPEEAEVSDQLIFAVMANEKLLGRIADSGGPAGGDEFARLFSRAVVETGAVHVVTALLRASVEKQDLLAPDGALAALLAGAFGGGRGSVAHTEMSTGHSTGTEMSTGHRVGHTEMSTGHSTGTEMSTGHRIAHTEMSTGHSTGTEMSTGHRVAHTEMSTGHSTGTEMSTGHRVAHTEMSTGHSTGTEMSTGHRVAHTEMSTGHSTGTEMSTGHFVGADIFGDDIRRITLAALMEHAIDLRAQGALDIVWGR